MVHRFSCPSVFEICLDQELSLSSLQWQTESYPLYHQESLLPLLFFFFFYVLGFWPRPVPWLRIELSMPRIRKGRCFWTANHWTARENPKPTILEWTVSWHLVHLQCQGTTEVEWSESRSVLFNSLPPPGLNSPWNSPGQNTGVGSLSLLRGS